MSSSSLPCLVNLFAINRLELTTDPQPFMAVGGRLRHPQSAIIVDQNDSGR